jgi:hypothetical protein
MEFISSYENILPINVLDECVEYIKGLEELPDSSFKEKDGIYLNRKGSDQFKSKAERHDYSTFFEITNLALANKVLDAILPAIGEYAKEFSLDQIDRIRFDNVKGQLTPELGSYSVWHSEQGITDTATRCLAWQVFLNDIPKYGEIEFLFQKTRIRPKKNTLLVWPAAYTHIHRGNPPVGASKLILTGWGTYPNG